VPNEAAIPEPFKRREAYLSRHPMAAEHAGYYFFL
jgi:hypothetical protein